MRPQPLCHVAGDFDDCSFDHDLRAAHIQRVDQLANLGHLRLCTAHDDGICLDGRGDCNGRCGSGTTDRGKEPSDGIAICIDSCRVDGDACVCSVDDAGRVTYRSAHNVGDNAGVTILQVENCCRDLRIGWRRWAYVHGLRQLTNFLDIGRCTTHQQKIGTRVHTQSRARTCGSKNVQNGLPDRCRLRDAEAADLGPDLCIAVKGIRDLHDAIDVGACVCNDNRVRILDRLQISAFRDKRTQHAHRFGRGQTVQPQHFGHDVLAADDGIVIWTTDGPLSLQSARAVIGFASTRGKRRVAVVVPASQFGQLHAAAARTAGGAVGASVSVPVVTDSAAGLVEKLRTASGGSLPEAVYLPVVGGAFDDQAAALNAAGIQILGSDQWSSITPYRVSALIGAWFAAPDPIKYEAFSVALEEQAGAEAGVLAGLAFDAVEMARLLGRIGQQNREGLLRKGGFDGILGPYRFIETGQCDRALAVLSVRQGATTLIGAT